MVTRRGFSHVPNYLNLYMAQPAWNQTHKMSEKYLRPWQKTEGGAWGGINPHSLQNQWLMTAKTR